MGCTSSSSAGSSLSECDVRRVYWGSDGRLVSHSPCVSSPSEDMSFIETHDSPSLMPGDECYVVSTVWMKEWIEFAMGRSSGVGPIMNDHLVSLTDSSRMKTRVRNKTDYRTVSRRVWEYYFERYGGGPVIVYFVPFGLDESQYKSKKWINNVNANELAIVVYPATDPNLAGRVSRPGEALEDRIAGNSTGEAANKLLHGVANHKMAEVKAMQDEIKVSTASAIGGMFSSQLGRLRMQAASTADCATNTEREVLKQHAAAVILQGMWRTYKANICLAEQRSKKQRLLEEGAALLLQSSWRVYHAKRIVNQMKKERIAALVLQKALRASVARGRLLHLYSDLHPHNFLVTLRSANGLRAADGSNSDPYVIISAYDHSLRRASTETLPPPPSERPSTIVRSVSKPSRRGSVIPASIASSRSETMTLVSYFRSSTCQNTVNPEWNERLVVSGASGSSLLVATLFDSDSMGTDKFLGQTVLDLRKYPGLYRGRTVDLPALQVGSYSVDVENPTGQRLVSPGTKTLHGKGTLSLSLRLPPLEYSMCGWVYKISDGVLTKGKYKKRWMILINHQLSYYEDQFTLDECKGIIPLKDVTSFADEQTKDGIGLKINFGGKNWVVMWDTEAPLIVQRMWPRKLVRCCSHLKDIDFRGVSLLSRL